jgi:hypothetical protein
MFDVVVDPDVIDQLVPRPAAQSTDVTHLALGRLCSPARVRFDSPCRLASHGSLGGRSSQGIAETDGTGREPRHAWTGCGHGRPPNFTDHH